MSGFADWSPSKLSELRPTVILPDMNLLTRLGSLLVLCSLPVFAADPDDDKGDKDKKSVDWTPLFDGKTTAGWRGFGKETFPDKGWTVEDGWLRIRLPSGRYLCYPDACEDEHDKIAYQHLGLTPDELYDMGWVRTVAYPVSTRKTVIGTASRRIGDDEPPITEQQAAVLILLNERHQSLNPSKVEEDESNLNEWEK
jgi:hypothetical protein